MTYTELQTLLTSMMPGASSGFIASPELMYYARMTNMQVAGGAHKFSWAIREYTLTLTGATEYNLGTLIPDLVTVYQIHGSSVPGYEVGFSGQREYNINVGGIGFTIVGNLLRFQNPPTSGTLTIPYYSNYLVVSAAGTRQLDFTDGTDISVIPNQATQLLLEGILRFYYRKEKEPVYEETVQTWDGRVVKMSPFQSQYWIAVQSDQQVHNPVYDFRYAL